MNDPRRVRLPWYSQRIVLRYLLPAALFAYMAVMALRDLRSMPIIVALLALFCGVIAALFIRIAWQERFPLRSKRRGSDEVE